MKDLGKMAIIVDEAARNASAIPQFVGDEQLSPDEAYAVQALSIARRLERGEKRIGIKMGLTSRAKMIQVNVHEVIWGRLTDQMLIEEGGTLSHSKYVHPRVEPEIAFLIKKPLSGKVSAIEALDAVAAIAPALEIIDSRYDNFKFALGDVIADNSSSSGVIIGNWASPDTKFNNLGLVLSIDGQAKQVGSSAAILGDPIRSLVEAAKMVARWGEELKPGDIVLAGGATAAEPLSVGMCVKAEFQNLGLVQVRVVE